jgi:hypothetical protein
MLRFDVGGFQGASWEVGSGRWCRACGSAIMARDSFGLNEGICPACSGRVARMTGRSSNRFGGGARLALRAAAAVGEGASRSIAALRRAA